MAPKLVKTSTPGIYKRGSRYVVVTVHRGKQHKTFHRTLAEAREAKGDRTGTGRQTPQSRRPFDEHAREWVNAYQGRTQRGFDADTRAGYRDALERYAIPHFRSTPLRDIDRQAVNALIAKMQRQGLSPATVAKYMAPVRALFGDAVDNGHLQANPALRLSINRNARRNGVKSERVKDMTRSELADVLAAIPDDRDRLLFTVLAHTGCRISEALGLDCSDVESKGEKITLRIERQFYRGKLKHYTKTSNGTRTITLSPGLGAELWQRCADRTGPIFCTRTGLRLSDSNLRRVLEDAVKDTMLPRVSPHSFRHTHGSILLDAGWPITEVAHRLGDDVQTVAKTYAHKLRDSDRELSFLDEMGKGWANEDPQTAANQADAPVAESAG